MDLPGAICRGRLGELLQLISKGIVTGGYIIRGAARMGRFSGEYLVELRVERPGCSGSDSLLGFSLVFCGRGPYRPWVEIYSFERTLNVCGESLELPGSPVEKGVLDIVARHLGPGESLFVEYGWDDVTSLQASRGVPAPFTRLGFELLMRGFTWFKLWYYPEGFMEGSEKIQAEKPLDEEARRRHLEELRGQAESLISRWGSEGVEPAIRMAIKNAKKFLASYIRSI